MALPWLFHGLCNLILAEVYYNADPNFENKYIWLSVTIVVPLIFMLLAILAFYLVFQRRIDPALHGFSRRIRANVPSKK